MDDDFMGASVWGTPEPSGSSSTEPARPSTPPFEVPPSPLPAPTSSQPPLDAFDDDFDDFDTAQPVEPFGDDDDFGTFGDFDEQAPGSAADFRGEGFEIPAPVAEWEGLRLDPMPSRSELKAQINEILDPLWAHDDISGSTTQEDIRQVEGISQILITQESRDMHTALCQSIPPTKPPNWTRSRIRRQHLIALGIPVNLDEVLPPQAAGKPLPTLLVTTRPMSAPPGPRSTSAAGTRSSVMGGSRMASPAPSRSGTPKPHGNGPAMRGLTGKPQLDEAKLDTLLALDTESLTLSPLTTLERNLAEIKAQTINTSSMLTYLLQTRDALQQDSETYNGLIGELVGEAQKKSANKGRTVSRRGTGG